MMRVSRQARNDTAGRGPLDGAALGVGVRIAVAPLLRPERISACGSARAHEAEPGRHNVLLLCNPAQVRRRRSGAVLVRPGFLPTVLFRFLPN